MTALMKIAIFIVFICGVVAPPVTKNTGDEKNQSETKDGLEEYMEYHRYLREVVNALESDIDFKKKLEKANEDDIRSGKIAHELEFVSHHVRTQLDEIKRRELDRLRELIKKKNELENNDIDNDDPLHHHLDQTNIHTFEIDDLKKLIKKTTEDLAEADRKRREEFKLYELQKEFEKQQKLNESTPEEREKIEKEIKEMEEKHKKHEKLHQPGHKQQLEEVWEEQDQMQQDFDPRTFFVLHDLDGNGLWDETEVKALFIKELDKMYADGAPEDDMRERAEEMERMRESVFTEVDTNKDGFIDYKEFLAQTKRNDFQQDHGWQGLDEQKPFSREEYEEYIRQHNMRYPPPGYQHMPPPGHMPQGYHPQGGYQAQQHPNAPVPPQYHAQQGQFQGQQAAYQGNQQQYQGNPQQYQGQGQQYQGQYQGQQAQYQGHPQQYQGQPQQYQGQPPQYQQNAQHPQQQENIKRFREENGYPPMVLPNEANPPIQQQPLPILQQPNQQQQPVQQQPPIQQQQPIQQQPNIQNPIDQQYQQRPSEEPILKPQQPNVQKQPQYQPNVQQQQNNQQPNIQQNQQGTNQNFNNPV